MIINVAEYAEDPRIRKELIWLTKIRETALELACSIPGYAEADLKTSNYIYDEIRNRLMKTSA